MDNLTHTVIGVLVGEAAASGSTSGTGITPAQRRNLYVTVMAVGSNLPDLDFLYSTFTGTKLDYLLHHRGHTHTFVGALIIALLLAFAGELWLRKRSASRRDRIGLLVIALLAPVLHIAMDMTNNYGVHPWWPFHDAWMFGDSVFIIEPLFWAAAAPLLFVLRARVARSLIALILVAGIALSFLTGMVPTVLAIAITAITALMAFVGFKLTPRRSIAAGIALWLVVTVAFITTSHFAGRRVDALVSKMYPHARMLDRVLTPMPVNPVCWELILVQTESESLVLRRGMFSMLPSWIPASRCPGRSLDISITAPLQKIASADTPELKWHGEVRSPMGELLSRWAEDCHVDAFMRFARAPWLARIDDKIVIGDLRYDREAALGFAELAIDPPSEPCPTAVPSWTPPRADLALDAPTLTLPRRPGEGI
jgi:inner membrane protein